MSKMKRSIFFLISVGGAMIFTISLVNYVLLQKPLSDLIDSDPRNKGIEFSARYAYYIFPSTLVIDVKSVSGDKSAADIFRVLLQYAEIVSTKEFDQIELSSRRTVKFILEGDYFQKLGMEYGTQNPVYTMRTFPENVYKPDGKNAFGSWSGGLLGVMGKQMEDFTEFHKQWYVEDMN